MLNPIGRLGRGDLFSPRRLAEFIPAKWLDTLTLAGVFLLALVAAAVAVDLTRFEGRIAAVWPVNAILFFILIKNTRAHWPGLLFASFAGLFSANLLSQDGMLPALLFAIANVAEVAVVAGLFQFGRRPRLLSSGGGLRLLGAAIAGSCWSTAIVATVMSILAVDFRPQEAAVWFAANALGYLLVAPLLWALVSKPGRREVKIDTAECALQLLFLAAATLIVFWQTTFPVLFLISPALVWLAFLGGGRRAALGMLVVASISLPMTLGHRGPVALIDASPVTQILILQLFLAINTVTSLAVGAVISNRRRLLSYLNRSRSALKKTSAKRKEMLGQTLLAEKISGVGHWSWDVATEVAYWSPQVYAIHGVPREDFAPQFADAMAFYADEDRARVRDLMNHGLKSGEGWEFEATLVRRSDNARRLVTTIGQCLKDDEGKVIRAYGVFRDITAEHQLFKDLAEREDQYRLLADHSTDVIVQLEPDGTIIYASPSFRTLGIAPENAVGRSLANFVVEEDKVLSANLTLELFSGVQQDTNIRREFRVRNTDGELIWLEGRSQLIRNPDRPTVSAISTFRNVTERREREDALAAARQEAELAGQAKTEFLSNMSHEIRTPLNGLLGFTQLIEKTELTETQAHFVKRISSAGQMLREIVDHILDFSKIEAGKLEVEIRPFSVKTVVREIVELVDAGRANRAVPITLVLPDVDEVTLAGDELRVRQILLNVLSNAAKFTHLGTIQVRVERNDRGVELCVEDTGTGIAESQIETIFEGFRQADSSVTRRFGGTGLGLSISRSLARMMGGDIQISSTEGVGTLVRIVLPDNALSEQLSTGPLLTVDVDKQFSARVMAVDDVEFNLELLQVGLTAAGHKVSTFQSAELALHDLQTGGDYDIILMDVQMPDMDGTAAARIIRAMPGKPSGVPIVALTAHALPSEISEFLKAGMSAHFSKPIDLGKLNQVILQMVNPVAQEPSAAATADPMSQLRLKYRGYLSTVADEFDRIMQYSSDERVHSAVCALAHSIAGTAGSLGYSEVSETAFELESAARAASAAHASPQVLRPCLDRFLQTVTQARA